MMPPSIPVAERAALREEAVVVIRDRIVPAYTGLLTMIRSEYLTKARTSLAAVDLPDGRERMTQFIADGGKNPTAPRPIP